ncbi:S49 family peptidase [Allohahella sp. A8]|uniref:S49 family peptidase n=1 Tax=Allohahella sp. A8 TaxID=3141461 RepID=UPI000C0A64E8|nr:S49 family peptidase [Hahellaceae bacterium]|tara:strand:- start:8240 stop:9229 length:990 start_codon:yes stop_codon:yes gene_type:complete
MTQRVEDGSRGPTRPESEKEWRLIQRIVTESVSEQRRSRRWGIFFKLLTFVYLFLIFFAVRFSMSGSGINVAPGEHTAIVDIEGVIMAGESASADRVITALRAAFEAPDAKAVVIRINSPGGSPVQAGYIYDEIRRLRTEYPDKEAYAVIVDIGASGGYYIAAAADMIYADKASLVGSIGVTATGFGFVEAIEKLGVERRVFTAGAHKAFLDPFIPVKPYERELWEDVLQTTHQQFIEQVRKGRGDRLEEENELLYSGVIWSGEQALDLGLIDGLGSSSYVAREIIGAEELVDYTLRENPFENLVGQLGVSIGKGISALFVEQSFPQLR